ncbi:MAG: hypothetical protein AUH92_01675 [Acidobacteria bacterium 13_1_40CM_4_69_4]|nr:MAG: hypothetical protein AUH92_01675 [Acidobacteria bacterium 13_1_40CM_4_69_4]
MPLSERSFFDLYAQNFVRAAVAIPRVALADPAANAAQIARLYADAAKDGAAIVLFPELAVSGYSLEDLHQQEALLRSVLDALAALVEATAGQEALLVVGAPLRLEGRLFNCAVVLSRGRILGIVPKTYIPNYREFYEKRQFASSRDALQREIDCLGRRVPVGADLVFRCDEIPDLALHVEICEDVWAPIPPSTYAALRGATVLANLSASNITVGKTAYRHLLAASQSGRCIAAYLYAAAGQGESTTDLAWDGHGMIYENGELLAESERFRDESQVVAADLDLDRLVQERMRFTSFADCATAHAGALSGLRRPRPRSSCGGRWIATPSCRPRPRSATRAATRRTTSRSAPWRSACAPPGSGRSSSARAAGWTRRRRSSWPPAPWTGSVCLGRTCSPTRCPGTPPPNARSRTRSG